MDNTLFAGVNHSVFRNLNTERAILYGVIYRNVEVCGIRNGVVGKAYRLILVYYPVLVNAEIAESLTDKPRLNKLCGSGCYVYVLGLYDGITVGYIGPYRIVEGIVAVKLVLSFKGFGLCFFHLGLKLFEGTGSEYDGEVEVVGALSYVVLYSYSAVYVVDLVPALAYTVGVACKGLFVVI